MNNGYDRHPLHIKRAKEKRDRLASRRMNSDATQVAVKFPDWLRYKKSVANWRELKPYQRWDYFNEYQMDCVRNGVEYENPVIYGLYDTIL